MSMFGLFFWLKPGDLLPKTVFGRVKVGFRVSELQIRSVEVLAGESGRQHNSTWMHQVALIKQLPRW